MTEILQVDAEINALAALAAREGVRSFLEIGSKFGGSLERIARVLPAGSRIVSVDLPCGTKAWAQSEPSLKAVISKLRVMGHDAQVIWGSSQAVAVIEAVRALGPFDLVFVDGDHRMAGVTADWINYGPMGKIVAFHDIAWRRAPEWVGTRIDVPEFWNAIKGDFRHEEFRFCETGKNNGIGVLWREAA